MMTLTVVVAVEKSDEGKIDITLTAKSNEEHIGIYPVIQEEGSHVGDVISTVHEVLRKDGFFVSRNMFDSIDWSKHEFSVEVFRGNKVLNREVDHKLVTQKMQELFRAIITPFQDGSSSSREMIGRFQAASLAQAARPPQTTGEVTQMSLAGLGGTLARKGVCFSAGFDLFSGLQAVDTEEFSHRLSAVADNVQRRDAAEIVKAIKLEEARAKIERVPR